MNENDDNGGSAAAAAASGGTGRSSRRRRRETEEEKVDSPLRKRRMVTEIESCNNVGIGLATPTNDNSKRKRRPVVAYQPGTANNKKDSSPLSDESVIEKSLPTALPVDKEGFIGKRIAKQDPSKVNFYGDVRSIEWDTSGKRNRRVWVVKWGGEKNLSRHGVSEMNDYYQYYRSLPPKEDPKYRLKKNNSGGDCRHSTTSCSSPRKKQQYSGKPKKKKRKGGPGTIFIFSYYFVFAIII